MSQKIDIRERRYNGVDYDTLHPETNINMVLDSGNNSVGDVSGALYGDGNGNIVGATISNPNLLDNAWFTVNQRGAASGTNTTYIADRWFISYGSGGVTWSRTDDSITFQSTTGLSNSYLLQTMEQKLYDFLGGKTVTISIMLNDYSILSGTTTFRNDTIFDVTLAIDTQGNKTICGVNNSTRNFTVTQEKTPITIRAVKLELGSVSTLANDVAPNYTTELLKCQRYFVRLEYITTYTPIASGLVVDTTAVRFTIPLPTTLRALPSITVTGTLRYAIDGTVGVVSDLTAQSIVQNNLIVTVVGTGFTLWKSANLFVLYSPPVILDISADL